jgi:hypothetical protein
LGDNNRDQSEYIEGAAFAKRCLDELGYQPFKIEKRPSPFNLEWLPDAGSLRAMPVIGRPFLLRAT